MLHKIKNSDKSVKHFLRFGFFCFVGFCSFLIDWGFFNLFYSFGLSFILAITFSVILSMLFNFSVNRNITFSGRGRGVKRQIFRWLLVYFFAFLARVFVGKIILILLGETLLTAQIAYFMGILIAIPIDYFGSLLWAFRK
jgi:putative flippase GtrA